MIVVVVENKKASLPGGLSMSSVVGSEVVNYPNVNFISLVQVNAYKAG